MTVPDFPPSIDHESSAPVWAATADGRLALPACSTCGQRQWYPVAGLACHPDATVAWADVPTEGSIYTFTRVERAFLPHGGEPPYTLALVQLDGVDDARVVTVLVGPGSEEPAIGDRVRLAPTRFETHTLPTFELVGS